jgi:ATP/maltotriose-dependent transcriptional regulator MalT
LFHHLPKDVALILDDYHVITADSLHRAMTYLVEHAPPAAAPGHRHAH